MPLNAMFCIPEQYFGYAIQQKQKEKGIHVLCSQDRKTDVKSQLTYQDKVQMF